MITVVIRTVPQSEQRYPTVGDWLFDDDSNTLTIIVNEVGDWKKEVLVAVHELVEAVLCRHQGVPQVAVDEFDLAFEKNRAEGDLSEPGDDKAAPYYRAHQVATGIERILAAELEVDWQEYEKVMS